MKLIIEIDPLNPRHEDRLIEYQNEIAEALFKIFPRESIEPIKMQVTNEDKNIYRYINGKVVKR